MNRIIAVVLGFVLWTMFAGWIGWEIRDGRADFAAVKGESSAYQAKAQAVTEARAADHANAAASTKSEDVRLANQARTDDAFRQIDQEVAAYAVRTDDREVAWKDNPAGAGACLRGPADDDFMRIWRAQNAGQAPAREPVNSGGAAAAGAERDPAADRGDRPRAVGESRAGDAHVPRRSEPGERADLHAVVAGRRADQWRDAEAADVVR